jgi:hypothetical protein
VQPFIDAKTRDKVRFVYSNASVKAAALDGGKPDEWATYAPYHREPFNQSAYLALLKEYGVE